MSSGGNVSILQSDLHYTTPEGLVMYENTGLYGVDRQTRQNVKHYGDLERTGRFAFSPHVQKIDQEIWNAFYLKAWQAIFQREETVEGLRTLRFQLRGRALDETAGYSTLPNVPRTYRALTDADGTVWVELTSGVIVDVQEKGTSYFVDAIKGTRVADFIVFEDRFTAATALAQRTLARREARKIRMEEEYIPLALLLGGVALCLLAVRRRSAQGGTE